MSLKTLSLRGSAYRASAYRAGMAFCALGLPFACCPFTHAQTIDCNAPIVDNAHIFNVGAANIRASLDRLVNAGADPRVLSDDPPVTPEQYADSIRRACPAWQSASGGVKNNLIVFLVFPAHRKSAVLLGSEYAKVLDTSVLRTDFMNPSFRDRDWALGIVKGIDQAVVQIQAHREQALHPAPIAISQQATDFHGLWVVLGRLLGWLVALLSLGALIWLFFWCKRQRELRRAAQQEAVAARNDTAQWLQETDASLKTQEALSVDVSPARATYDAALQDFTRVSQSETFNPDTKGLSADAYRTIAGRYRAIRLQAAAATPATRAGNHQPKRSAWHRDSVRKPEYPPSAVSNTSTGVSNTSSIVSNTNNVVVAPITFIDEPYRPPTRDWAAEPAQTGGRSGSSSGGWSGTSGSFDSGSDSSGDWSGSSSSSDFGSDNGSGGDSGSF